MTRPFEYSVATALADGDRSWLKDEDRPEGVVARVVALPESECACDWDGVVGTAVEPSEVTEEMDDERPCPPDSAERWP